MNARLIRKVKVMTLVFGLTSSATGFSFQRGPGVPPCDGLVAAKSLVQAMQSQVQELIARTQGGGSSEGWPSEGSPSEGGSYEGNGVVVENDTAATFALQGMGQGLFALGEKLDQAIAAYGTPRFFFIHQQVCFKSNLLLGANIGAKTAAALPSIGVITPGDFDQFDIELRQVKSQVMCF